MKTKGFIKTFE